MATLDEIHKALADMRTAIDCGKFQPVDRKKNLKTLGDLGITWQDAKNEIYTIDEKNYYQGPMEDRDYPGSDLFWVFKKNIDGHSIYIKFKIVYQENKQLRVVSFHIDEYT